MFNQARKKPEKGFASVHNFYSPLIEIEPVCASIHPALCTYLEKAIIPVDDW